MENDLNKSIDKLIDIFVQMKKQYRWSAGDLSLRFASLVYVINNREFDKNRFDNMLKVIKENSKWYSHYRGHQKYTNAALLITKFDDPEKSFRDMLKCEESLKSSGFKSSVYLSIAAYALLITCPPENIKERLQKAMELYKEMKKKHFWLTSADDYPVAVLLAQSEDKIDVLVSEMEKNYDALHKEGFMRSNGLQFLSHLLTFIPGDSNQKAQKATDIYRYLKEYKLKVTSPYYGTIGFLTLLGDYSKKATEDVINVYENIKSNKNFRWTYKDMNILTATALVTNQYMEKLIHQKEVLETGIGISIETMIAAQNAALIAATSAATASAAASSGS